MAGFPTVLACQIVHSINGIPAIPATRMESRKALPGKGRFGPLGAIGAAIGQAEMKHTITFATSADKQMFQNLAGQQKQLGTLGFTYSFWQGNVGTGDQWVCRNCYFTDWSLTNDCEQGTTDEQVSFFSLKQEQIS